MSWERAWRRAMRRYAKADACARKEGKKIPELCDAFARPWQNLWNGSPAPPLFLNATIVESGQRFVQHPFRTIITADGFSLDRLILHGSSSSTFLIPASAPLSAVVHNSARFTYVSPAGRLLFRSRHLANQSGTEEPGHMQLVDGGYFENSATTTLLELAEVIAETDARCGGRRDISACNFHFIHISNDPGVPAMLGDSLDACTRSTEPAVQSSAAQSLGTPRNARTTGQLKGDGPQYGGLTAPLFSLLNTRDARGEFARRLQQRWVDTASTQKPGASRLLHYRLCKGVHPLPLGWTISHNATIEMRSQLCGVPDDDRPNARFHRAATREIAKLLGVDANDACAAFERVQ
jgi:hypothetical protein